MLSRSGFRTVATFARTWANQRKPHVLANVATANSDFETASPPFPLFPPVQSDHESVGRRGEAPLVPPYWAAAAPSLGSSSRVFLIGHWKSRRESVIV